MGKSRRTGAVMAVVAAAASIAGVATAAPASAAVKDGPRLVVNAVQAVHVNEPTWVNTYWTTRRDICDAQVTVAGKDVKVLYPSNTKTYTSFSRNDTLAPGWYDYAAVRVTAKAAKTKIIKLKVTISYVQLPKNTFKPGVDPEAVPCVGKELSRVTWVKLPVLVPFKA
jgi:hypothetical protein